MTPDSIEAYLSPALSLILIATSLALSASAIFISLGLGRRLRRKAVSPAPPPEVPLIRESERNGRPVEESLVQWSPQMLRQILNSELPDAELIVVSNREPYIHELVDGNVELSVPASGLVSALEPVTRTCAGTWIAHGSGSADRMTVDRNDHLAVPPDNPAYTLRRVWLTEEEYKGYYYGFANEGLWPLCHIAFTRPMFRAADWECYQAVNRKFADVVVAEAKSERPVILIQDYHFALLPKLIRDKLPNAVIITFWHIPWPNAEVFSVCPWREQILEGLLGSSILGFHIQLHCNNFIESVDRFLESRIDREGAAISHGGEMTLVHSYPISIEWPEHGFKTTPQEARTALLERYGLPESMKIAVGVERLDYTKGILDRFHALDEFFHQHSDWIGRLTFLQVGAPSRTSLPAYQQLHQECLELAAKINDRYGRDDYQPIILLDEHQNHEQLTRLYRAADVCVVSSLHDGMNLVAKEFVGARDDEKGVLVLSAFAGASRELHEAIIINPFDPSALGEAFFQALTMSRDEQRERMRRMREVVRNNNVYRWAGSMLLDAARLIKRGVPWEAAAKSPGITPANNNSGRPPAKIETASGWR